MSIYLPIAEMNVNIFLIVFIGMVVGALSGLFGVGGGFLMTPLLIFLGIPPVVAVGSEAPHVLASSVSGVIAHWRKRNVDFKMGFFLLSGGVIRSTLGVNLFKLLKFDIEKIKSQLNSLNFQYHNPRLSWHYHLFVGQTRRYRLFEVH